MKNNQLQKSTSDQWQEQKLGEVCYIYQPKTISGKDMIPSGKYKVFGANGIIGNYDKYNHEESQLLITCRGATCGSVNISEPKSWITGNAMVIRPKDDSLNLKYLEYLCRGWLDFSKIITGSAQPQITRANLAPVEISYPDSAIEQKRIVKILDERFAQIEELKKITEQQIMNSRELFESYLENIFANPKKGSNKKSLSTFCDIKHGFAFKSKWFEKKISGTDPIVLTPGNFREQGGLFFNERNTRRYNGVLPGGFNLDIGDLIVVMTDLSSKMKILGKPAVVQSKNLLHNQRIGKIICKDGLLHKRYLFFFFRSKFYLKTIRDTATGTMVKHTAPKRILENQIFIPSLTEQKAIVKKLDTLSAETKKLESIYRQKLADLEELKKSILQKAFAGEL